MDKMYLVSYANHCADTGCDVENKLFDNLRDARTYMLGSVCFDAGINDPETLYTIEPNQENRDGYFSNIKKDGKVVGQIGEHEAWMYDTTLGWTYSAYWKIQEIVDGSVKEIRR